MHFSGCRFCSNGTLNGGIFKKIVYFLKNKNIESDKVSSKFQITSEQRIRHSSASLLTEVSLSKPTFWIWKTK